MAIVLVYDNHCMPGFDFFQTLITKQRTNNKLGNQINQWKILRNSLFFAISENFLFRKLKLFTLTKGTYFSRLLLTRIIKENNHFLCVSKPLKMWGFKKKAINKFNSGSFSRRPLTGSEIHAFLKRWASWPKKNSLSVSINHCY